MTEEKKKSKIEQYWASLTPEEAKAKRIAQVEKRRQNLAEKQERMKRVYAEAEKLMPEIVANDLLLADNKNFIPKKETIDKFRRVLESGYFTLDEIRTKHFGFMSDEGWHRVMKFVFKSHISQIEDVGLEVFRAKQQSVKAVKTRIRQLKAALKASGVREDPKKLKLNLALADRLYEAQKDLIKINMDWAKNLSSIGAVGEKSKAAAIHLHMNTPRPKPTNEPKTINGESRPVSLTELLADPTKIVRDGN